MSTVTSMILSFSVLEDEEARMEEVEAFSPTGSRTRTGRRKRAAVSVRGGYLETISFRYGGIIA